MSQDFVCPLDFCGKTFSHLYEVISHSKMHMRYGFKLKCPFTDCLKTYNVVSSFSTHLARSHL